MTLFSLLISCVNRELVFVVDSISQLRLNFQRWFLVLQGLSFQWRFLDHNSQSVWRFHVVAINLFLLSIWCVGIVVDSTLQLSIRFELRFQDLQRLCFRWQFMVKSDAVSLAIPCVNDDSVSLLISSVNRELVFVVDSISQPRLNFQRRFLVLQWLSFRWWFLDQHWQSVCDNYILNHESIFAIDLMPRSCCRFHTSDVTQISVVISSSASTMFSLTISG
jgi:hypothetical protein